MADAETLKRKIKVCMFDQYGTVVDMQTGFWEVAVDFLKAKGWKGSAYEFVTWWRRTHFENSMIDALLHREHMPYREIGHLSVRHALTRARRRCHAPLLAKACRPPSTSQFLATCCI